MSKSKCAILAVLLAEGVVAIIQLGCVNPSSPESGCEKECADEGPDELSGGQFGGAGVY